MSKLFLNEDKIKELLYLASPNPRDYCLFQVALATGFRAGDLLSLKRTDVQSPINHDIYPSIRLKMQKTGRVIERELPIPCRIAIGLYLDGRTDLSPFLFCSQSRFNTGTLEPMNRSSLHKIFKKYLLKLLPGKDLRGAACHVTRRSVAKLISDRAGRIEPASRFLGHVNLGTTVAYLDMEGYGRQADGIVRSFPWNHA